MRTCRLLLWLTLAAILITGCGEDDEPPTLDADSAAVQTGIERLRAAGSMRGRFSWVSSDWTAASITGRVAYEFGGAGAIRFSLKIVKQKMPLHGDPLVSHYDFVEVDGVGYVKTSRDVGPRPWHRQTQRKLRSLRGDQEVFFNPLLLLDIRMIREPGAKHCYQQRLATVSGVRTVQYHCSLLANPSIRFGPTLRRWVRNRRLEPRGISVWIDDADDIRRYELNMVRGPAPHVGFTLDEPGHGGRIVAPRPERISRRGT
jgi:hypothetical protein